MRPVPFSWRLALFSLLIACVSVFIAVWLFYTNEKKYIYTAFCEELLAITSSVSAGLEGDEHERVRLNPDGSIGNQMYFNRIRSFMDGVARANALSYEFGAPIYTLRPVKTASGVEEFEFVIMASLDSSDTHFVGNRYPVKPHLRQALQGTPVHTEIYEDAHGKWVSAAAPIYNLAGQVVGVVQVDKPSIAFESAKSELLSQLEKILTLSFLVAGLMALVLAHYFIRPFRVLIAATEGVIRGAPEALKKIKRQDELGALGEQISEIANRLEDASDHGRSMALFAELNPMPVMRLHADGRLMMANEPAHRLLNIPKGSSEPIERYVPEAARLAIDKIVEEGAMKDVMALVGSDYYQFMFRGEPNYNICNVYSMYVAEQSKILRDREALIEELEVRQKEMEQFTYTVSHDLKSPVVTINGFVDRIKKDWSKGETEKVPQQLDRIAAAGDKMKQLLDELLELSRVGRVAHSVETIDMSALAHDAASLVEGQIRAHQVKVSIQDDMPTVMGDKMRLREVWQNLIDNAIKYRNPEPPHWVEVGSYRSVEGPVFFVKDNGLGIDPRYRETVFGLFDQLNPSHDGSGIGLALVKRIVVVHNGSIWVESEGLGHGSTFLFTLG